MYHTTLAIPLIGNPVSEILLGYKKIGFGQGKYTGFGGKVEYGEEVTAAALRELAEETGICIPNPEVLDFRAILEFRFPHKPAWEQRVFVFVAQHWEGAPTESDEMAPRWFKVSDIPYDQMWDDAYYWLPKILAGEKFQARFEFQADNARVNQAKFTHLPPSPDHCHTAGD